MIHDPRQARAFWLAAPGRGEIRDERLAAPGPNQVLVRTLYSGISRGTESLVFRGEVPPSQYHAMRAPFQQGDFPAPVKYGYCNVGVVEVGPDALRGQTVFCLYPHQDRYVVPATAVIPVPLSIPPGRAVLAANLETALNVLWDATPRLGDRITVIGAGTVGCLIACLAGRMPGCLVQLVDVDPRKAALATQLGVGFTTPDRAEGRQDCVIHASGSPAGLATALQLAGFEATVVEASWFGARPVSLPLGEAFHANRLRIHSSQVGAVATAQRGRWDHRRRMATVMQLLDDPALEALIGGDRPFAELPQVMADLSRNPDVVPCHRIVYADIRLNPALSNSLT
ncbi:MAG: zinc-binding alcohol dehydrogenase [Candidatus Competibacteraceae bacterium]